MGGGGRWPMWLLCHPSPNWTWIFIFDWFGFGFGSRRTGLGTRAWQLTGKRILEFRLPCQKEQHQAGVLCCCLYSCICVRLGNPQSCTKQGCHHKETMFGRGYESWILFESYWVIQLKKIDQNAMHFATVMMTRRNYKTPPTMTPPSPRWTVSGICAWKKSAEVCVGSLYIRICPGDIIQLACMGVNLTCLLKFHY